MGDIWGVKDVNLCSGQLKLGNSSCQKYVVAGGHNLGFAGSLAFENSYTKTFVYSWPNLNLHYLLINHKNNIKRYEPAWVTLEVTAA